MIKKLLVIFTFLFVLGLSGAVWAADINITWNQSVGATGYKVETSVDNGATWTEILALIFTTRTEGTLNLADANITVADNVLVLGRIGAYNTQGITWRLEAGFWYHSSWMPLPAPTGGGVN